MNIEHLKLFVRIASTHNISAAGDELGISPAVASSHINKLESALGVRLIHRTTRKVALTEEGEAFLPHAEEVLESVEAARSSIGVGSQTPIGTLRVTAPASLGRMHIVPAIKGFLSQYPEIKLDIRLSDTVVDMVEGGFDVAIRNAELKDSGLIARRLATDTRIICASPAYLKQFGEPKSPNDVLEHKVIHLAGIETWHFQTPEGAIHLKPKSQLKLDNGEAVRDACIDGLGLSISSRWCAHQHLKNGQLIQVLTDFPLESHSAIWAVYPSSRLIAPKVRAFIDYLVDYFGEPPFWEAHD